MDRTLHIPPIIDKNKKAITVFVCTFVCCMITFTFVGVLTLLVLNLHNGYTRCECLYEITNFGCKLSSSRFDLECYLPTQSCNGLTNRTHTCYRKEKLDYPGDCPISTEERIDESIIKGIIAWILWSPWFFVCICCCFVRFYQIQ